MKQSSKKVFLSSNFWKNQSVLVTGGSGFIGSWLTKELLELEAKLIVLDLKNSSPVLLSLTKKRNKNLRMIRGNVCNSHLVREILEKYKIDTIFHLAAQALVEIAVRKPRKTFETNIIGTWNLLENCRLFGKVRQIIIASSDKAYGTHEVLPYTEETPLRGTAPYEVSKSSADLISRTYYETYGSPVCITRCGNVFGGGDLNFSRIVPDVIRSAFENKSLPIRSDGTYLRDYIYVKDVVYAYLFLAKKMEEKKLYGDTFNFGTDKPLSVIEIAKTIFHLMGKDSLQLKILNQAKNEIRNQHLSSQKAKEMLGWHPQYTLEEGLKETINWYQAYFLQK